MTSLPKFDFVAAQRRAYARAKARSIFQEMDDHYGFQREAILTMRLDESLSEYEKGLEKLVDYCLKQVLDHQAVRMNPTVILKPGGEEKYAELT